MPKSLHNALRPASPAARRRGERGVGMIEMAVILPLFLLLVMGIFEFGRLFYIQLSLQSTVREATRYVITGQAEGGMTRTESVLEIIEAVAPTIDITPDQIRIVGPGGPGDAGGPGDIVTIIVDYSVELATPLFAPLFPGGKHEFSVSLLARNEPFPM